MKLFADIEQQSEAWHAVREIRPTASHASRVITSKGKDSDGWQNYVFEMADNRIRPRGVRESGKWTGNRHTDRGNETEPVAREAFARMMGVDVAEVGFITRDDGIWGCSPDGLALSRQTGKIIAGVELKCPDGLKHLSDLDRGTLPPDHIQQVHASMAVTGLDFWYFVSYCEFYEPLILRIERDDYTAKVEDAMNRFQAFYLAEVKRLMNFARKEKAA